MATIPVDIFTLTGASRDGRAATVNGLTVNTASPLAINASVTSIENAAGSTTANDVNPGSSPGDILITANTNVSRAIDPLYFGFNVHNQALRAPGNTLIDITDATFETLVGTLPIGLMRYIGGPDDIYWDPINARNWFNPPGTYNEVLRADTSADFDQLLSDIGKGSWYVSINMQRNDFADWRDFANEAVTQGWNITDVCGGNEENAYLSAAAYVTRLENYIDEFEAESAAFVYGAPEGTKATVDNTTWTRAVLSALRSDGYDLEYITAHTHQLRGREANPNHPEYSSLPNLLAWPQNDPPTFAQDRGTAKYYEVRIATLAGLRDTYFPNARVMWTEFSPSLGFPSPYTRSGDVFNSVGTALWAADLLGRAARVGCDAMLHYTLCLAPWRAPPSSYPSMLFQNDLSVLYPIYYTYLMFGQWWGDDWVTDVTSDDEALVSVNGSIDDTYIYVMLINKTADDNHGVHVTITHAGTTWYITDTVNAHSVVLYRLAIQTEVIPDPTDNMDYWLTSRLLPQVG